MVAAAIFVVVEEVAVAVSIAVILHNSSTSSTPPAHRLLRGRQALGRAYPFTVKTYARSTLSGMSAPWRDYKIQ